MLATEPVNVYVSHRDIQRSPSATAAGEPRFREAREQRVSPNFPRQMGRRLLAARSLLRREMLILLGGPRVWLIYPHLRRPARGPGNVVEREQMRIVVRMAGALDSGAILVRNGDQ